MAFWQLVYELVHHSAGCVDRTESTRSVIVYGGNCVQAWLYALHVPGVAWQWL